MCDCLKLNLGSFCHLMVNDGSRRPRTSSGASTCAPQAGTVHPLAVHTVGGVINNGETIMQIVPRADELVLEAKVAPFDIDQIATGAACGRAHHVRQPASRLRACPLTSNDAAAPTIPLHGIGEYRRDIRGASPSLE